MKVIAAGSLGLDGEALEHWEQHVPSGCSEIISGEAEALSLRLG